MSIDWKQSMGDIKSQLRGDLRAETQARLEARRYIVRIIDARDDWTKCVTYGSKDTLTASKRKANRFKSLAEAVRVRNYFNKQDQVKSAWIIFE